MVYLLLAVVGVPLFALVFSGTVLFLGLFWDRFKTSGPGGFRMLYGKMLIISAIYLGLAVFGIHGLTGLVIMAVGYSAVFGASWVEALVIGILGGTAGWVLFIASLMALEAIGLPLAG